METIALSPPTYNLKKRPLEYTSNSTNKIGFTQDSPFDSFGSNNTWNDHIKRSKFSSSSGDGSMSPIHYDECKKSKVDSPLPISSSLSTTTTSNSSSSSTSNTSSTFQHMNVISLQKQIESMIQYHEIQVSSIRNEYEKKLSQKDEQINYLMKLSKQLHESNTRLETENRTIQENNKVLKKGFAIQDHRQRELLQQNQQYQAVVQQLSDYTSNIERTNQQLKQELLHYKENSSSSFSSSSSSSHFLFHPPPPPDVF